MDTLFISRGQTVASMESQCADGICEEPDKVQNEIASYRHEGYLVRVHFNGDKTLGQCIRNLAEQRMGG